MSSLTGSNSKPRVSTAPEARPQNMKASSGSALKPMRTSMGSGDPSGVHFDDVAGAADRVDPALPARDLQARAGRCTRVGDLARAGAERLARVGERDGEEARGARPRRAHAVPQRRVDGGGRAG